MGLILSRKVRFACWCLILYCITSEHGRVFLHPLTSGGDKCSNVGITVSALSPAYNQHHKVGKATKTSLAAVTTSNSHSSDEKNNKDKYAWLNKRGARYESLNSTIPTATEAAIRVGVEPPLNVSAKAWKRAWVIHRTATPFLHKFDKLAPPDSKLCLMCLWWKALSGNNPNSPVFDDKLHYDMLPSVTRKVLRGPLKGLYPRLHHSNVEIRTAYLDQAVQKAVANSKAGNNTNTKIRLISMGAGYDLRSVKFRLAGLIDQAYELDLPEVIDSKSRLLKERLQQRRPEITNDMLPTLFKVNLNQVADFESILNEILTNTDNNDTPDDSKGHWKTIFLFEAVMIYLDEGVPTRLLETCRKVVDAATASALVEDAALCFADRLDNIPGADLEIAQPVLRESGWEVAEWNPKPGLARHMGMLLPTPTK